MKNIPVISALVYMMLMACQQKEQVPAAEDPVQETQEQEAVAEALPSILKLKPSYETEITQWEAFNNLEIEMQKFQKAVQNDNTLIVEDLINLEKQLSESGFPEKFDIPAIKSRLRVFKTYLLQTKALTNERTADSRLRKTQCRKILTAFNAVKKQLAQTLTGDLTEQLLKDLEEQLKNDEQ